MAVDIKNTNFYNASKQLLENKINKIVTRKISEFVIQFSKVLTPEELKRVDLTEILDAIKDYHININLCTHTIKKTRQKREIDGDKRCMARIGLGTQCTRSKMSDVESDYCKSHKLSLPYGRIDGPIVQKTTKMAQRRGRKQKAKMTYELEDLDISKYIQATVINIDDNMLIQDENGLLYTYDTVNQIIGRVIDDKIVWY